MNEYNIKVDFTKGKIFTNLKKLVQNDYNSTKLNFTFDKEGRVLFKMLYPDGTQYVAEIENNELVFGKGVLNQEGTYEYEIALYTEDGRITDYAVKSFEVRSELVDTDELVEPDDRLPVLNTLINEVNTIKKDVEEGKYNGKDGANGSDGQDGITPTIGDNGNWYIGDVDTGKPSQGPEGPQGPQGEVGPQGPAGGISLEEVKEITGELENLNTEDKSSLVNAINEILNSSGDSGITEINNGTIVVETAADGIYKLTGNCSIKNRSTSMANSSSYTRYLIIVRGTGYCFSSNGTMTYFSGGGNGTYNLSFLNLVTSSNVLTKTNTTSYTPTANYHPATKIYVDEAIAALKAEFTGGSE